MSKICTCEQVSRGHVDKICDQIADAIVTDCLRHDRNSRVAVECLIKNNTVVIAGEITSGHESDYAKLVSRVFEHIGVQPLVASWRQANPRITRFWWDVDAAVKKAVVYKTSVVSHGFRFYYQSGMLFIDLPSGRRLSYVKPRIGVNRFGSESVTYEGINLGKWTRLETYGPKVTENLVQAVSRDILAYAMKTLRHCFIVGSVHDELIIECSPNVSLQAVCDQMGRTPPWLPGIDLRADGYECSFYMKA